MALNVAVGLTGGDHTKISFSLKANATSLNRHGAESLYREGLPLGMVLEVRDNRGTTLSARVVPK